MDLIPKLLEELQVLVETNKQVAQLERMIADQQLQISELQTTVDQQNFRIELLETEIEELQHDQTNSQESSSNLNQRTLVQCEPCSSERRPAQDQQNSAPDQEAGQQTASIGFLPTTPERIGDSEQPTQKAAERRARAERTIAQHRRNVRGLGESIAGYVRTVREGREQISEPGVTIDVEARAETPSADLSESNQPRLLPTPTGSGSMASGSAEQRRREPNHPRQPQSPTVGAKRKSKKRRKPKGFAK